jgi:hypothetical protein
MALSETFPAPIIRENIPPARAPRSLIPITARELVEWTYAVQLAHRGGEVVIGHGDGISQTGLVIERLLLGCTVDTSAKGRGMYGAVYCDEDALTVHGIVEGMPSAMRSLLIRHGELRSTPEWQPMIMPLRCVPVPGRKGNPKGIYAHHGKTHIGSEITYEGDWPTRAVAVSARAFWPEAPHLRCAEEVIEHARKRYSAWIDALVSLSQRIELAGKRGLRRYCIHGLGAEHKPWHI